MVDNDKTLDCVEMKHQLQQRLLEKWKGKSDEEIEAQFQRRIAESQDSLAAWWRRVREQQVARRAES